MKMRAYIETALAVWSLFALGCRDTLPPPPPSLSIRLAPTSSGDGQTDTIGGTLADPLRVLVLRGQSPAGGIAVSWTTPAGSVSPASATTDASGIAQATWSLGDTLGVQSATASLVGDAAANDTVPLHVSFSAVARAGAPTALVFHPGPSNAFVGRSLIPAVAVASVDRRGNVATDFHGPVTITLGSDPGGASLNGTTIVDAVDGVARFTDLSLDRAGAGYTLSAAANGPLTVTSTAFEIVSPGPGRIAFQSTRDDPYGDIYTMNADGSGLVNLTNNPMLDEPPAWSPDGTKIAFVSNRSGDYDLYVMNVDGTGVTPLTHDQAVEAGPEWSPDGTRIVVSRTDILVTNTQEIYVVNADGSGSVNLTNNPADDATPAWSPDGSKIAFESRRDGNSEIYVVNVDGSGLVNLTNRPEGDYAPAWSPDGTRIAFFSGGIHLMNADGSGITQLIPGSGFNPRWSPDGQRLAFTSAGVAVMNADGTGFAQLIADSRCSNYPCTARSVRGPAWSPSSARIAVAWDSVAFSRGCRGVCRRVIASGISVLNPDGSGLVTLVETPGRLTGSPAWSPR